MIAGLEGISSGDLYIGGRRVNNVLEKDRDIAMVFQELRALPPHDRGAEHRLQPQAGEDAEGRAQRRVRETAHLLGLEELLDLPAEAAERRAAPAGRHGARDHPAAAGLPDGRAALEPRCPAARAHAREIEELQKQLGVTTVYVTHDQIEAMTMGDRVAVMRAGELQQVDTPTNVYDRPVNLFVAGFMGSPPMNLARATIGHEDGGARWSASAARRSRCRRSTPGSVLDEWVDRSVIVGVRPAT